jgi:hypothetical protein
MDRWHILIGAAAVTTAAALAAPNAAAAPPPANPLNPPGIKVAGIRMLPVRGGRYKVWTKTIGEGPVTVLLLHGGPPRVTITWKPSRVSCRRRASESSTTTSSAAAILTFPMSRACGRYPLCRGTRRGLT